MKNIDLMGMDKEELVNLVVQLQDALNTSAEAINAYKNNVEQLQAENDKLIIEKRELNEQIEELIRKYEHKAELYRRSQIEQFCPKTEKIKEESFAINEAEVLDKENSKKGKGGRRTATKNFIEELKKLATRTVVHDFDFEANGIDRESVKEFDTDDMYKIEYHPASFEVVKHETPKYKDKENIYQATSTDVFPHSPLTPSLAANIIEMKFNLSIPLDRYSHYLRSHGLPLSPQTLGNYVKRATEMLYPLYDAMVDALVNNSAHVIHSDETKEVIIDDPDRTYSYMFVYTTSFYDKPIYIYQFNETRAIDKTKKMLEDFEGYVVVDGYDGYNALRSDKIQLQRCLVHARRYFNDAYKILPETIKSDSVSYHVLQKMEKIFEKENEFKKEHLTINEIKEKRNSNEYLQLIKDLDEYIDSLHPKESTLLAKAVDYYHNMRPELFTYLENGYVDCNNNLAERTVKPFVIGRKNWMFNKNYRGATNTGIMYSIVHTAKANGLKTEHYLAYVIENINTKNIDELLPWSEQLPKKLRID